MLVGTVQLSYTGALLEYPAASAGNVDGSPRSSAVTDPASDLQLAWNTSAVSAETVDIVLAVVDAEADEPREFAAWVEKANSGTYVIPAEALAKVDLEDGPVFFKVSEEAVPSRLPLHVCHNKKTRGRYFRRYCFPWMTAGVQAPPRETHRGRFQRPPQKMEGHREEVSKFGIKFAEFGVCDET